MVVRKDLENFLQDGIMFLQRLGCQQKIIKVDEGIWNVLEDRLQEALPGTRT